MTSLAHELPDRRPLTAAEVLRMVEAGILSEDEPVELIDGALIIMSPQGPRHNALVVVIRGLLEEAFGDEAHVQDHSPIDAGPHDLPEPDLAVVRGPVDFDRLPAGRDVLLAVEISVSSQRADRAKARVYARAGVACYWNIDVPERRMTVYTDPDAPHGEYRTQRVLREGDHVLAGARELVMVALLPPAAAR